MKRFYVASLCLIIGAIALFGGGSYWVIQYKISWFKDHLSSKERRLIEQSSSLQEAISHLETIVQTTPLAGAKLQSKDKVLLATGFISEKGSSTSYQLKILNQPYELLFYQNEAALKQVLERTFPLFFVSCILLGLIFFYWLVLWTSRTKQPLSLLVQSVKPYLTQVKKNPLTIQALLDLDQMSALSSAAEMMGEDNKRFKKYFKKLMMQCYRAFETMDEGVAIVERAGMITYLNSKLASMLHMEKKNYQSEELSLLRKNPHFLSQAVHGLVAESFLTLKNSKKIVKEERDSDVYYELIASYDAENECCVLLVKDYSDDYKMLEMGKSFVANASHELRTPITIIRGFAEALKEIPQMPPATLQDIVDKILKNCQRMTNLVKNLLVLANLDTNKTLEFQKVDLTQMAVQAIQTSLLIHPEIKVETFFSQEKISIQADPQLLELLLTNLLENAVKYSKPPAFITVSIEANEDQTILRIQDRGIGMSAEDLKHIFERFFRVNDMAAKKVSGAGLGLSIVSSIVKKHNAKIEVTSEPQKGSTFSIAFASVPIACEAQG